MANLDQLLQDARFSLKGLTASINSLPVTPTKIADMELFEEDGISTLSAAVASNGNSLTLVPAVPRGAPSQPKATGREIVRFFSVPHLPQRSTVMADSVQASAIFGSGPVSDEDTVLKKITELQVVHRRDNDMTIEYHRLGAIAGKVLDADGTVLHDINTEFSVLQKEIEIPLLNVTTNVRAYLMDAKRYLETRLGGISPTRFAAFAGPTFMDLLTNHDKVLKAFENYDHGSLARDDVREGFSYAGINFDEYFQIAGYTPLIEENEALLFPIGVPGMFITRFAPADYIETVNTKGLPYYTKVEAEKFNRGIAMESQSNPLNLNTRPDCVVRLKVAPAN